MATAKCGPVSFQRNRVSAVTNDSALDLSAFSPRDRSRFVAGLAAPRHRPCDGRNDLPGSGGVAPDRQARSPTVADEGYGSGAPSARVLPHLRHEQPEVDNRR
jgi:hypothetical protein